MYNTTVIIFSKDRACQLDLFLRTFIENVDITGTYHILYTFSTQAYKQGYDRLISMYDNRFNFIEEVDFKTDLLSLYDIPADFILHLTDDNYIRRPVKYDKHFRLLSTNDEITMLTMSMGKNLRFFTPGDPMPLPEFINSKDYIYEWEKCTHPVWRFPRGLTTTIYRREDVIEWIPRLNFYSPNSLEVGAKPHWSPRPFVMCWPENRLISLSINLVQTVYYTISGNISPEWLNTQWLMGKRIDRRNLDLLPQDVLTFYDVDINFE